MLKKTGIIIAAVAAGAIALTPFAFAHDGGSSDVNYSNVESGNLSNDCEFGQQGPAIDSTATGGSSLAAVAGAVTDVIAPVTTQTQALNCTNLNVSDVIDFDSNNDTATSTETEVEDSGNTTVSGG
ncbi:hypothetical protein [Pseudonocardia lacus]|uniref:hypothetical protein n=1 Tax=Pseudonocardia lacus TaxID=2835865 RepID=UPI001BDC0225|nr:hypothetical protein [Pseudonocardia lacus]